MIDPGFYHAIRPFRDARGVSDPANFVQVPEGWTVVLTDVRGSTAAILAGRYKDVNLVGASSITSVLNALQETDLPYVFGGDGATLLVPATSLERVRRALLGVQAMSLREFGLQLRIGAVPVAEVVRAGFAILVAKYALSKEVCLAMFSGGGLQYAESLLKGPDGPRYQFTGEVDERADMAGLECRWQPLRSTQGEVVSVLIKVVGRDEADAFRIYRQVVEEIESTVGRKEAVNPATSGNLKLNLNPARLRGEQRVHSGARSGVARLLLLARIWCVTLLGWLFMTIHRKSGGMDWGGYPDAVSANTDFWKYDDMLRFVIDVTPAQKGALVAHFEERLGRGELVYGLHSSSEALMTCLVFNHAGNHVHFIDGGDGGYAIAAKEMKEKLKALQPAAGVG